MFTGNRLLILTAAFGVLFAVSCGKDDTVEQEVSIKFSVSQDDLTKTEAVQIGTLVSLGFYANATTGAAGTEDAVWTNARFKFTGNNAGHSEFRSAGKVWPEGGNPGYRFYASNVPLSHTSSGPTVSSEGYYWSCTPYPNNANFSSCMLNFLSNDVSSNSGTFRFNGCSVRLVRNIN